MEHESRSDTMKWFRAMAPRPSGGPTRPLRSVFFFVAVFGTLSWRCSPPTTVEKDLLELQRLWQYLKVYSIYQDRVPDNPFSFDEPHLLAHSIGDTIKDSIHYTTYWAPWQIPGDVSELLSGQAIDSDRTYFFARLSQKTSYLLIPAFKPRGVENDVSVKPSTYHRLLADTPSTPNLILDLRGNGGGVISVLDSCMELFLGASTPYIQETVREYDRERRRGQTFKRLKRTRNAGDIYEGLSIAVLIDGATASAAEIMAAGLRDALGTERVRLFGSRTFGKSIGQYYRLLDSGAAIRVTNVRFRRIVEDSRLQDYFRTGIPPDTRVSNCEEVVVKAGQWLEGDTAFFNAGNAERIERETGGDLCAGLPKTTLGCCRLLRDSDLPPGW